MRTLKLEGCSLEEILGNNSGININSIKYSAYNAGNYSTERVQKVHEINYHGDNKISLSRYLNKNEYKLDGKK